MGRSGAIPMGTGDLSQAPRFICLAGVDGCGKSTLARMLHQELTARGIRSRVIWLRMNYALTRPILLYCRLAGLTRRPVVNGQKISIHEFHRAPLVARLVQILHSIDTARAYFFKAYLPMRLGGETIVCDRFVYDVLIDFIAESGDSKLHDRPLARRLLGLMPREAQVILIKVEREVLIERRLDVLEMDPYFDVCFDEYATLDQRYNLHVVHNNGSKEDALGEILELVLE